VVREKQFSHHELVANPFDLLPFSFGIDQYPPEFDVNGYLVRLVNVFAVARGFDNLLKRFTQHHTGMRPLRVEMLVALLKPIEKVCALQLEFALCASLCSWLSSYIVE